MAINEYTIILSEISFIKKEKDAIIYCILIMEEMYEKIRNIYLSGEIDEKRDI